MNDIWESVLKRLEEKLDSKELKTWFTPARQVDFEDVSGTPTLRIEVPNRVFVDWIESRHGEALGQAARDAGYANLAIRFEPAASAALLQASEPARDREAVPLPAPASRGIVLNPRFTFETFVVGSSNQFAHAAARAVAETPSRSYNPLFLYGGVGLGKTHLMHAIAHDVLRRSPDTQGSLPVRRTVLERAHQRAALREDARVQAAIPRSSTCS